ncbi:YcnI family protein [Caldibacillus lycopersici]|uniref:YcnI family protein n=1 Tax=Perspicuibacillus lycopersici TaxID=1325689 RepID=A0AAE3IUM9_9BACI|nr:YcnI family protein [Perspicuibacillus lycopersici]MCU9614945.1 YcnI family protein [Perspicuibacillus lycopersici]
MKKIVTVVVTFVAAFALFTSVASAHVTVQPTETSQGKYEVFTVRVPSENETVPTTKVQVKFDDAVNITRFEPKPGWTYTMEKDDTGKITSVTWTADEQGLAPTEFAEFKMQGKVSDDAEQIVWKAYQTYQDGSVVEWVGAPDAETPASVTVVNEATVTDSHDHGDTASTTSDNSDEDSNSTSNLSLYLSIAALVLGLVALGLALKKRK